MHPHRFHRVMLVLMVIASFAATAMITIKVFTPAPGTAAGSSGGTPEPLWDAPDFSLINQDGQPVTRGDLRGKAWVAEFFFTSCPMICPAMNQKFKALQDDLDAMGQAATDVKLISFSIDPKTDRPQRLRDYGQAFGYDPARWTLLTSEDGEREAIWTMVGVAGFKLAVQDTPDDPVNPISHSPKFVLIDRIGRVRGFYDSDSDPAMKLLRHDIRAVLAEPVAEGAAR